jgi:glycyl-tRNA synthetase
MSQTKEIPLMEKIVSLCKRKGFIFQSSEIYGGINGFWDYGPLGAELKRNLRTTWWNAMMREREDVVPLDATIIMHPAIWKASGHVDTFADMMRECSISNKRVRADHVPAQSGVEYLFRGVKSPRDETSDEMSCEYECVILCRIGEHAESVRKRAREAYTQLAFKKMSSEDVKGLVLVGEQTRTVEGSIDYHPETGGKLRDAVPFNLMLKTYTGATATEDDVAYLRPETAQAIFVQFKNVVDSTRVKVPFGIGQIGKAFRNEVTPRNFTFRSREFEQMELEFFIPPDEAVRLIHGSVAAWSEGADLSTPQSNWGWEMWHRYWVAQRTAYYAGIGLGPDVLDYFWQTKADLAHYARACVDILFKFPFGTEELEGIAARGDFDLTQHQKHSGKPLEVFDEELRAAAVKLTDEQRAAFIAEVQEDWNEHNKSREDAALFCERLLKGFYVPHVIEPSAGLDRLALAVLTLAYTEVEKTDAKGNKETLTVMRFHPRIAPKKVAVFPLLKNKPELVAKARAIYDTLKKHVAADYDEGGSIGKRYARQDEAGTPFCVTVDFDTLGEKGPELLDTVTLRHRDDGSQERVKIGDLPGRLLPLVS